MTVPAHSPARPRVVIRPGAVIVLLLVGLGVAVLVTALGGRNGSAQPATAPSPVAVVSGPLYVHVLGAVLTPGLYQLAQGDRAVDAVAAAGGFADGADETQLNLARLLVDGEQIYVPVLGEATLAPAGVTDGKVNLNTADQAMLETLPSVGPALAQRILAWRETNGRFTAIEDLLTITGIGDKTFDGLRDLVSI